MSDQKRPDQLHMYDGAKIGPDISLQAANVSVEVDKPTGQLTNDVNDLSSQMKFVGHLGTEHQ